VTTSIIIAVCFHFILYNDQIQPSLSLRKTTRTSTHCAQRRVVQASAFVSGRHGNILHLRHYSLCHGHEQEATLSRSTRSQLHFRILPRKQKISTEEDKAQAQLLVLQDYFERQQQRRTFANDIRHNLKFDEKDTVTKNLQGRRERLTTNTTQERANQREHDRILKKEVDTNMRRNNAKRRRSFGLVSLIRKQRALKKTLNEGRSKRKRRSETNEDATADNRAKIDSIVTHFESSVNDDQAVDEAADADLIMPKEKSRKTNINKATAALLVNITTVDDLHKAVLQDNTAVRNLVYQPANVSASEVGARALNRSISDEVANHNHPVLALISQRAREKSTPGNRPPGDTAKLALSIEGGGMVSTRA
jgi:hypothetical protein